MLTIIGVVILLTPVLIRTWREFNRKLRKAVMAPAARKRPLAAH